MVSTAKLSSSEICMSFKLCAASLELRPVRSISRVARTSRRSGYARWQPEVALYQVQAVAPSLELTQELVPPLQTQMVY